MEPMQEAGEKKGHNLILIGVLWTVKLLPERIPFPFGNPPR